MGNPTILEQLRGENYKVLVVILSVVKIVHVKEGVRRVGGAGKILKSEPEVLENLHLSGLTIGEFLRGFPVLKVLVVCVYDYWMW